MTYFKFLSVLVLKKWPIYLTSAFYFGLYCLLIFGLPLILKIDAQKVLAIKILFSLLVLFGAIAAANFSLFVMKIDLSPGMATLVLSRPISRTQIIWSKLSLVLLYATIMSLISLGISGFTNLVYLYENNFISPIILGSFIGTLVVLLTFSGITILLSLFLNKLGTFSLLVCFEALLLVINIICMLLVKGQIIVKDDDHFMLKGLGLVTKNEQKKSQPNYSIKWGTILQEFRNRPVTLETQYKGLTLKQWGFHNLDSFPKYLYDNVDKRSNLELVDGFDFQKQLASLYTYYTNNYIDNLNIARYAEYLMWESNFANEWKIEMSNTGFDSLKQQNDLISYQFAGKEFYLGQNPYIFINNNREKVGVVSSVSISNNDLVFPIWNNDQIELKQFKNLQSFGKYFFSKLNNKYYDYQRLMRYGVKIKNGETQLSYIYTAFIMYVFNNANLENLDSYQINRKFFNFAELLKKFQIATISLWNDIYHHYSFAKYPWLNEHGLNVLLNVLNACYQEGPYFKRELPVFVGGMNEYKTLLQYAKNETIDPSQLKPLIYNISPAFVLIPQDFLGTFNESKLKPAYDYAGLLTGWLTMSVLLFVASALIFAKKDFK